MEEKKEMFKIGMALLCVAIALTVAMFWEDRQYTIEYKPIFEKPVPWYTQAFSFLKSPTLKLLLRFIFFYALGFLAGCVYSTYGTVS